MKTVASRIFRKGGLLFYQIIKLGVYYIFDVAFFFESLTHAPNGKAVVLVGVVARITVAIVEVQVVAVRTIVLRS